MALIDCILRSSHDACNDHIPVYMHDTNLMECGYQWSQFGPMLTDFWPTWTPENDQNDASSVPLKRPGVLGVPLGTELEPILTDLGQFWPTFGRHWSQILADRDPKVAPVNPPVNLKLNRGKPGTELEPILADLGKFWPTLWPTEPICGQIWPQN
jgi:hypothetical protein